MNQLLPIGVAATERLEIVRTSERLIEIGPAWRELRANVDGLIFQSHDWISAWWETASLQAPGSLRINGGDHRGRQRGWRPARCGAAG